MSYQEIGGSPKEQYDRDGFSADREFLIPWEERTSFAEMVFGTVATPSEPTILTYPGREKTVAVRLKMEPFDPGAIGGEPLDNVESELPQYDGSFVRAVVHYESVVADDLPDLPNTQPGSWITYRMVRSAVEEEISLAAGQWADNPTLPVPAELKGIKRIPITEHHLTWNQVVNPPWTAISALQGKVNAFSFLGCEPGTLLFDGAEGNKLYHKGATVEDPPSSFTWQIRYVFREKSIKFNDTVYGWNHFFRTSPAGWVPLLLNQKTLYDAADFVPLFSPEEP